MKEIIGFAAPDRHVTEIVGRFAKKNLIPECNAKI